MRGQCRGPVYIEPAYRPVCTVVSARVSLRGPQHPKSATAHGYPCPMRCPNQNPNRIAIPIPIRILIESQFQSESKTNSKRIPIPFGIPIESQTNFQFQSNRNQIPIAKESFRDSNPTNGIRSDRIFLGIESSNLPNPESPNTSTYTCLTNKTIRFSSLNVGGALNKSNS